MGEGVIRYGPGGLAPEIGAQIDPALDYAFVINTDGGFFNQIPGVNPGGYGNIDSAQLYILLHELGHRLGVLETDAGLGSAEANDAAQRRNDKAINQPCGDLIRAR